MEEKQTFDYIVVGQGLAGSVLSYSLLKRGKRLLLIDTNEEKTSSKVAAGIFNPITGRKMVKTWLADQLFPFLKQFYSEMEIELQSQFFHPTNMYFPFLTQEKQNDWLLLQDDERYRGYIKSFYEDGLYPDRVIESHGGMEITKSGYLNIPKMLSELRKYLTENATIIEKEAVKRDFIFENNKVQWGGYEANQLILCDGVWGLSKEFCPWLDFRPVKGEVLTITFEEARFDHVVNRNGWVLPMYNRAQYKFGATYNNREVNTEPSEEGRKQLIERLENLVNTPYKIEEHKAGIRPATYDRRPFVGFHPENTLIAVFNGLGAKGVSLAPFLANHFVNVLEEEEQLMAEVDIKRCYEREKKRGRL